MPFARAPDLFTPRRLTLTTLAVTGWVWVMLCVKIPSIDRTLGDTDDAMRLTLVHDLLGGRGWFDQRIMRLWPPHGVFLHWSRLLDGALAGAVWLVAQLVSPSVAETVVRYAWPLFCILPAVAAALSVAGALGTRAAVLITAVLLIFDLQPYVQFVPGRIDHHNVQIVMSLIAFAAAVRPGRSAAGASQGAVEGGAVSGALAGAASGLGLALGLETLVFLAAIGAAFGLRLALSAKASTAAAAYGAALAVSTAALFAIETPPARWTLSFCDAVAINLVGAAVVGGLGLALVAARAQRLAPQMRLALLLLAAGAAAAIYVGLAPACLRGPFAGLDPRVRPFWFDRIQEIQPWPTVLRSDPSGAIHALCMGVLALAAGMLLLARRPVWRRPAVSLSLILLGLAVVLGFQTHRMQDYLFWYGMPILGAGLGLIVDEMLGGRLVFALGVAILAAPAVAATGLWAAVTALSPARASAQLDAGHAEAGQAPPCAATQAYAPVARLPPGVILADIDLGPYTLALTPHAVVAAPYHRMSAAILASHLALHGPEAAARGRVEALGADYVMDCAAHAPDEPSGSLAARLHRRLPPPWLTPLSTPQDVLQVYRVGRSKTGPNTG